MSSSGLGNILDVVSSLQKQTSHATKETKDTSRGVQELTVQLDDIEARVKNVEAVSYNTRIWRPYHRLAKVKALVKQQSRQSRGSSKPEYIWRTHQDYPHTVAEFKRLQFEPGSIRSLLEFYELVVYRDDEYDEDDDSSMRVSINPEDKLRDIKDYTVPCMEALAAAWGLNWDKISGLNMPRPRNEKGPPSRDPKSPRDNRSGSYGGVSVDTGGGRGGGDGGRGGPYSAGGASGTSRGSRNDRDGRSSRPTSGSRPTSRSPSDSGSESPQRKR